MDDQELANMTLKELLALKGDVEVAIRSAIARSRPNQTAAAPAAFTGGQGKLDLESERDAWRARKKAGDAAFHSIADSFRSR